MYYIHKLLSPYSCNTYLTKCIYRIPVSGSSVNSNHRHEAMHWAHRVNPRGYVDYAGVIDSTQDVITAFVGLLVHMS